MSDEQPNVPNDETSRLQRDLREVQRELRLVQRDLEQLQQDPTSGMGWRRFPLRLIFALIAASAFLTITGMLFGYSKLQARSFEGRRLTIQSIHFDDGDYSSLGRIDTIGPTLDLRKADDDSSISLSPRGLRMEDSEAISWLEPYTTIDGLEGVRIHVRSSKDPSRAASIFLALPDGQEHTKPMLMLLDANNRPVE